MLFLSTSRSDRSLTGDLITQVLAVLLMNEHDGVRRDHGDNGG